MTSDRDASIGRACGRDLGRASNLGRGAPLGWRGARDTVSGSWRPGHCGSSNTVTA